MSLICKSVVKKMDDLSIEKIIATVLSLPDRKTLPLDHAERKSGLSSLISKLFIIVQ